MGHSACDQEFQDLKLFLEKAVPGNLVTEADVSQMSVRELKNFLQSRNVNTRTLIEKSEFIEMALSLLKAKADL
jgi:hypothetical protein